MDPDFLRITLAILGALVIAGLYYWEQRRRQRKEEGQEGRGAGGDAGSYQEFSTESESFAAWEDKHEPRLGVWGRDEGDLAEEAAVGQATTRPRTDRSRTPRKPSLDLSRPAPELADEVFPPGPLLQILHVAAQGPKFDGAAIVHAARVAGLEPGEREIFHCRLGDEHHVETLFSMANMVKPGTFPFGAMAEFETPGLTLFAQLDGQPGDPGRLEELLGTAHQLAKDLGGELLDDHREPLTPEGEERLRQRVMAFVTRRMAEEG